MAFLVPASALAELVETLNMLNINDFSSMPELKLYSEVEIDLKLKEVTVCSAKIAFVYG